MAQGKYDVLVVGAGILGLASAYHIKRNSPGRTVLVIDRYGDAAQGNTGRSNAMFRDMFTSADNRVLSGASIEFYAHVQRDMGVDVGVDPIGYLWLMSEAQMRASSRYVEAMERGGVRVERYAPSDLSRLIPGIRMRMSGSEEATMMNLEDIAGGLFGPNCGRLAPERLASFYKDELLKMGGALQFGAEAVSLMVEPERGIGVEGEPFVWQDARISGVRLEGGREIRAGTTVVAGGAWNNQLLDPAGIDGHAKAKKRQLFAVAANAGGGALESLMRAGGFNASGTPPFMILPKAAVFVKPVRETQEFWLGCEDELNRPFISAPERDLDRYYPAEPAYYEMNVHQILRQYLPQFEGARPARMWAGLYSYNTLDNLPYVFGQEGLVVVGGDSGSGVMKGDSLGRLVDAFYREGEGGEANLFGDRTYRVSKLGFVKRNVEREEWVI